MLDRIGQWIGRQSRRNPTAAAELTQLAACRMRPPAQLERLAEQAVLRDIEPGLIDEPATGARDTYLRGGSLQIQTRSGYVLTVEAGSPQAAYPIPLPPDSVSVYAAEPSRLLSLPAFAEAVGKQTGRADAPAMSDDQREDLARLRKRFANGNCDLPSLPDLALRIGRAIDDAGNSNRDIARVIQLDPALTARMLSIVNSPAFGGCKKISTITQATTRLGRARVRSLVYSCLVRSIFKINSRALERRMEKIWERSVTVAALSFVLGRETPGVDAEHAMLAGLTHAIGAVAVLGGIKHYPSIARHVELLDFAIDTLGVEAGIASVRQWDLNEDLENVISGAGRWHRIGWAVPDTLDIVNLAMLHAAVGKPESRAMPAIDQVPAFDKLPHGRLSPHRSLNLLEEAESDVREVRRLLSHG
jgi:HD-like signal output (HDOD) protein